ncbi:pentapeptide repeat-containing protein [Kitasatospora griseola]|uniref:pentapeptide repeat-containing protein n=1 Tax=Kitasatospora griseola TaxID=2064 RepID=UPI00380D54DE
MPDTDRTAYLATLTSGSTVDLRGTTINEALLQALLLACTDQQTGHPRLGDARFRSATFTGTADFGSAVFSGIAGFRSATFTGTADFGSAAFTGIAEFGSAAFIGAAEFGSATFTRTAVFEDAVFNHTARFESAAFNGDVRFRSATFSEAQFGSTTFNGTAVFEDATFDHFARFESATFYRDARFGSAAFSYAMFGSAVFHQTVRFRSTVFNRDTDFGSAAFNGAADFGSAVFNGTAGFRSAVFRGTAGFGSAVFNGTAGFRSAVFNGAADFGSTVFNRDTDFGSAAFSGAAEFRFAAFNRGAQFDSAGFEGLQHLGPLVCMGRIGFEGARFTGPQATIEMAAREASFDRVTFAGSVVIRLRYSSVQLARVTLGGPSAIQAWPMPFAVSGGQLPETGFPAIAHSAAVRILSLDGVDAAQLVLTDIDLAKCQFTGAFHLDQIRIGFGCTFARPPSGWRRSGLLPARWSARKVLAEEHHWRAQTGSAGWQQGPYHGLPGAGAGPEDLAGAYQQLRKAFEEAGNEPDAADFYYGEMEMRRHDRSRPRAERRLLWLYWLASGYGLRASRALSWLVAAMGVTLLAMMLLGLPNDSPDPQTTGTYSAGTVKTVTKTPDPSLTLPWRKRVTVDRAEKGALVVVNSVVFRSSGQNLTLPGTVIEMASRIGEPVLLGLAALAVRSRVKR